MLDGAKAVDRLGYDHLWTWDHIYAIFGDPYQDIFEGWSLLAAWAMATRRRASACWSAPTPSATRASRPRSPATLDHISDGRAILGIGGAWIELEHVAHGIDFGSGFGQRLDWMDEAVGGLPRGSSTGRRVTSAPGAHYAFKDLRHSPRCPCRRTCRS